MQVLMVQSRGGEINEEVIEASMFEMDPASDDGLVRAYTHSGSICQGLNTGQIKSAWPLKARRLMLPQISSKS